MVADPLVKLRVLPLELDVDVKVHVPPVAKVGLHTEGSFNLLTRINRQVVSDVEYSLFPVSVGRFWRGSEADLLVGFAEVHAKVGDECVDVVITTTSQGKVDGELEVFYFNCVEI